MNLIVKYSVQWAAMDNFLSPDTPYLANLILVFPIKYIPLECTSVELYLNDFKSLWNIKMMLYPNLSSEV